MKLLLIYSIKSARGWTRVFQHKFVLKCFILATWKIFQQFLAIVSCPIMKTFRNLANAKKGERICSVFHCQPSVQYLGSRKNTHIERSDWKGARWSFSLSVCVEIDDMRVGNDRWILYTLYFVTVDFSALKHLYLYKCRAGMSGISASPNFECRSEIQARTKRRLSEMYTGKCWK